MELPSFIELIKMSKEQIDTKLAPIRAKKMQAKIAAKLADVDECILNAESKTFELCAEKEINLDSLTKELDQIALLERRKEQLKTINSQLFPEQ